MAVEIKEAVREKYGAVAREGVGDKHRAAADVAQAFGYSAEQLASIPQEANLGLSCGNPTAIASLKPGEFVLDLGCGGGLDVFLAAAKVGPTGKAIGVDMTPEMLDKATRNALKAGLSNVEFVLAEIEKLPLADNYIDCVVSNCVLNLVPDKRNAFREIFRILKPGGRLCVSDIALKRPLPAELSDDLLAYVGCISGAISFEDYRAGLAAAGFVDIEIIDNHSDLNAYAKMGDQTVCCAPAMVEIGAAPASAPVATDGASNASSCCAPASADPGLYNRLADLLTRYNVNDYAASVSVRALKR